MECICELYICVCACVCMCVYVCVCVCVFVCVCVMRTLKALHEININFVFYYNATKSGIRFPANPAPHKICITNILYSTRIIRRKRNENEKKNQHYLTPVALRFRNVFLRHRSTDRRDVSTRVCIYFFFSRVMSCTYVNTNQVSRFTVRLLSHIVH